MVEIPDSLVERIKARQTVLVAGLGCSELAGAPGWLALIEWLAARLPFGEERETVARLIEARRLGDAAAWVRDLLMHGALRDAIREAYPEGDILPETVRLAAALPWRAVVTTGYDNLWWCALTAASEDGRPPPTVAGSDNAGYLRVAGPHAPLMHLHGMATRPESLCLGPGETRTRLAEGDGVAWLGDLRRRRSLVLVGFRPADPDLEWLTAWLALTPGSESPHYLFLDVSGEADPETEARLAELRTGLVVLPCRGGTAEAMERLAQLSAEIGRDLPPTDADIDLDGWLARWDANPADPEPSAVLARAAAALREETRWDRLTELLLRRLPFQEDREDQVAALREVETIFRESLGAPETALKAGIAALRLSPSDDELWKKLRADAGAAGAWDQLVAGAMEVIDAPGIAPDDTVRIWREVAAVLASELERPDDALDAYREALAAEPGHPETRDEQVALLRKLERWPELVEALRAGATETVDLGRASELLREAADVLEVRLGDVAAAISTYEGMSAIDSDSPTAVPALERLYERERRWADLAALLDRRAGRLPPPAAAEARRRRAEILVTNLGERYTAADELEALVASDPADRAALQLLERIYRESERFEEYLRTLRRLADAAGDTATRLDLLRRLAAEGEARPGGAGLEPALEALEEILRVEPRDPEAFPSLVRVCQAAALPARLAEALSRRIEFTDAPEARRDLLATLAETSERELDDPERAFEAYAAAERIGDRRFETYEALVRLAKRSERWGDCATALLRWAEVTPELEPRVELLLQAALLQAGPLGDLAVAEAGLEQVLELVPDHAEARAARARVCRAGGDFARAAGLFVEAAAREPDAAKKAQLFAEAGVMAEEQLGDEDRAVELYVQALSADPRLVAAAERLARIYVARGRWAKAEPILDMLVGLSDPSGGDTDSQVAMQLQLAGVAAANGNVGKALAAAAEAYRLQPESLPVLRQYADLLARRQEWKQAGELYGTLLRLHRAALPPTEIRDVLLGGGQCRAELGDNEDAIGWYEDAVAIDSGHRPAIEALARLHAATQDWASWLEDRRALVTIAAPEEHPGLLEEIADAQVQHLADGAGAEATYQAVLNLDPGRRSTRKKLLELFTRDKRWQQAAEALVALAEGEEDAAARAEQLGGAVRMWRDQLQQPADSGPVIAQAIAAYEALTAERQGEVAPQEALAELYLQAGPEAREKAIAAHQRLLAQDPNRLASYQALAKLYGEVGAADKQWCLAATLTFFKKAGPELETIYKRHRPARVRVARHRFDDELWLRARHPDEDRLLDALFVLVGAYAAEPAAHGPAALGLLRRKRVDPAQDSRPQVRALVQLAKTFDVPTPELFLIDGEGETEGATTIVNLRTRGEVRPTLILGPTTLARTDEFELVFDLGKHMAFLRPERFLRFALGTPSALDLALRAILALAGTPIGPGAANGETARLTAYLRRTVPSQLAAELAAAGRKLLDARGPHIDLDRWIAATDLSAARAALVVAGDLEAAARVIWSEPAAPPALTSKERLKDLIAFSISEDYFACRSQLGLGVR